MAAGRPYFPGGGGMLRLVGSRSQCRGPARSRLVPGNPSPAAVGRVVRRAELGIGRLLPEAGAVARGQGEDVVLDGAVSDRGEVGPLRQAVVEEVAVDEHRSAAR